MMDTIKLEAVGERVRVTCRREVGDIAKVRWLSGHEAVALGLLLASKTTAHYAINLARRIHQTGPKGLAGVA